MTSAIKDYINAASFDEAEKLVSVYETVASVASKAQNRQLLISMLRTAYSCGFKDACQMIAIVSKGDPNAS